MNNYLSNMTSKVSTLVELLHQRALYQPNFQAYTFLLDGETKEVHLTYRELDSQARAIATRLQNVAAFGERALLLYPPGFDYIAAFFGCLYAGVIAVPAYPPRVNHHLLRLEAIVADAQATVALTDTLTLSKIEHQLANTPSLKTLQWITTDNITDKFIEKWQYPEINAETPAFLQYTSGSTGTPRGVIVSHANLLHNEQMIKMGFQHTEEAVVVGWLPLYHDMGLIGNVLHPVYMGCSCILMSPIAFIQKPLRWLQAISRYKATTSGGPNFAYDLCVQKINSEQKAALDLSSWQVAFNGAEPIRAETLERFAAAFEPYGFCRNAFYPCYGMAETTLIVSGGLKTAPPVLQTVDGKALQQNRVVPASHENANIQKLVGCGNPLLDLRIVIAHPETLTVCEPDEVGEIWVSSPSVAQGYWKKLEESKQTFQAYLANTGEGPFLRTGDLGFLKDGELFVTGRLKDLIIIRGRNHYPQDIEATVEQSYPALRPSSSAAFTVEVNGEERLVVAQEVERQYLKTLDVDRVAGAIRQAVVEVHDLQVYAVLVLKTGSIPKTSSGKIQRHACRSGFLNGSLNVVGSSIQENFDFVLGKEDFTYEALLATEPDNRLQLLEFYLQKLVAQVLKVNTSQLNSQQPLSTLGLDSLMVIELKNSIETNLGVVLPIENLLQGFCITQLADKLLAQLTTPRDRKEIALVPVSDAEVEHPLSYGQRALWFLHQLAPESPAYNITRAVRLKGEPDIPALKRAFQALVERHPSLRTTFTAHCGEPVQQIHEHGEIYFQEEDASDWSDTYLNSRLIEKAHCPFNLEQGPLMQVSLFARSPQGDILLLTVHHIVTDFWSLVVLVHELGVLYQAEKDNMPATLTSLDLHYVDYVRWQTEMLASPENERLWAYWHKQLAGNLPVLNLPTDRPRSPIQTYRGASQAFQLTPELTQRLKTLSNAHQATLYMTLLAAFQVLLYRYTGQEDILVGSPTTGRSRADLAGLVGYFVNPVVMRADLSENPTFEVFLEQVRSTVLDALKHQDYPFALLVERLVPVRDSSYSPLFQVLFVLQKAHLLNEEGLAAFALGETGARIKLGELELESFTVEKQIAQFDLSLNMAEVNGTLFGSWQYNTDLFDAATITRLASHFQTLLENILANPQQRLADLPLLSEPECQQLLVEWNYTKVDSRICIHQLFEAQVKSTPDAVAVVFADQQLTYSQLNCRANSLAHHLRTLGVGPDVLVGICTERSLEMIVGVLGILKAGGAYVPIDPLYPQERIAFILEDTQVPVLLTQAYLLEILPKHQTQIICLDTDWGDIALQSEENPIIKITSKNLAYVIYTSGSTGKPKGVMNTLQGLCNRLQWMQNKYQLTTIDRILQKTPFSFDVSVWEFFWPLLTGACLVFARPDGHKDTAYLAKLIIKERITTLHFVPSMLQAFLEEPTLEKSPYLRRVICSGEALPSKLQERFFACLNIELHNLYGPTEASIDVTFWECKQKKDLDIVPIGRPIDNTQIYILDQHLQPMPIGVRGELHIGGVGLARGYVNQPGITAEKFIPNPFSDEPGTRLYKTGDLARYLPNGDIEYLGRIDHQVKIRGFRIELGEIETLLMQHEAIQESVVLAREDIPGDKRLVAYVVPNQEYQGSNQQMPELESNSELISQWQNVFNDIYHDTASRCDPEFNISGWNSSYTGLPIPEKEMCSFLKKRLPDYMVPSAFVLLPALPLTSNGKVDRQALLALGKTSPDLDKAFVAPETPTEEILAAIWTEVLGLERVGIYDNFFELGGHSLLATQLMSRVYNVFGVDLPLHSLFEAPTIAAFAQSVKIFLEEQQDLVAPPILPIVHEANLPLSFAQQRLWFIDQLQPNTPVYNIPYGVRLIGHLNIITLQQAVQEIVRRHEALRTTFTYANGNPVQVISPTETITLLIVNLQKLPAQIKEAEVSQLVSAEAQKPFDLAHGPLLRITILQLSETEYVLLVTIHHIVSDMWSLHVFVSELFKLYEAFSLGKPSPLPELPVQYIDFTVWQRKWLQEEVLKTKLSYWKQQLDGAPPLLALPIARSRRGIQNFQGAIKSFTLPATLSEALKAFSLQEQATLFMTLLAAFQVLLHRYTGYKDIIVSSGVANRSRGETEALIGCFINILIMRTDMSGNPRFRELLKRVRKMVLEAYAHQDLPFELLVEALQPERDLSYNPLTQVMFVLQNAPIETLRLPGLSSSLLLIDRKAAQFDLILQMWEDVTGLQGFVEYNTELFYPSTIDHMIGHFQTLLEGIVSPQEQPISYLPLLTDVEQQLLLTEYNATQTDYQYHQCLHHLFEARVAQTPDAIAVYFEGEQLTYQEVNRRANQLAHYLRSLGVKPEVLVGICIERSLELVVGLLGILKAGGAYVPMDPMYPTERLAFMVEDAKVSVLLTQEQLIKGLPMYESRVVCLDKNWDIIARECAENLSSGVTGDNLAYAIYTSGSTGRPKGVAVKHCGVVNNILDLNRRFAVGSEDRLLAISSLSFDMCVYEVLGTLESGGAIVMPRASLVRDPAHWAQLIVQHWVTVWNSAPSLLKMLIEYVTDQPEICPHSLRLALLGGDWIPLNLPDQLKELVEGVQVISLGGATEASIHSIIYPVETRNSAWRSIPYGQPMANQIAYVLDVHLQPLPVGVPGELYLGGVGLARCYWNRPELTAEKFIANPFSHEPGARLYKTGDLARYQPDGNIELLGRIDDQVKLRGFRIELAEIIEALKQHPAIREAVVVAKGEELDDKRLVAYIVSSQEPLPTISELRSFLKKTLPEYMVPTVFVTLDALPLSPNGKVDRRALPTPDSFKLDSAETFVAPRTPVEEVLAGIWIDVLGLEQVGIYDNFFEIGGHSLLATQVVSRVRDTFLVDLSLSSLFESPTIAEFAEQLKTACQVAQLDIDKIAQVLIQLHHLSDEQVKLMFASENNE
ncbi:amino acid adenylation domain-containing protein [Scytonema sp. UIC 10036]|uniref:non-ribosomal peptide synthetase n=1 Tax=Scytonema sp. UIC 10036 TaxID=2304196 RepID=UPI0012DA9639|nr:non-ribosomal peptide synthetase [Scytonema sp. UIC 10036]MUG92152.1 amino acid adenylation domain-containing protein [Scytonema sp. UIC 10036]